MSGVLGDNPNGVNLYEILGVDRKATEADIKRTYRKLAMELHPDKNPNGAERFKEVTAAYRILIDPEQRTQYDTKKKRVTLDDLKVELTTDELRDFVKDLLQAEKDEEEERANFEKRRAEEMKRREEFEKAHPNFKMSSYSYQDIPDKTKLYDTTSYNKTGGFHQGLGKSAYLGTTPSQEDETSSGADNAEPDCYQLAQKYGLQTTVGSDYKRRQLEEWRAKSKSTSGVASTTTPLGPDGVPLPDTDILKTTYDKFDYEDYVAKNPSHGLKKSKEQLADAILADALNEYNYKTNVEAAKYLTSKGIPLPHT